MEPLLRALTDAGVKQMTSHEPSLEELFLAHYGTAEDGAVGAGTSGDDADDVGQVQTHVG